MLKNSLLIRSKIYLAIASFVLFSNVAFTNNNNENEAIPVILVHGFLSSKHNMKRIEKACKKQGFSPINNSYKSRDKSIEDHAKDLLNTIEKAIQNYPDSPVHFITHSMGGLVLKAALNSPNCPIQAKIGKAVLIAPPNNGSYFAKKLNKFKPIKKILGKKSGRELALSSENRFSYLGTFPEEMKILVISGTLGFNPFLKGKNDGTVSYKESCIKTEHQHISFKTGHCTMCYVPKVVKASVNFLNGNLDNLDIIEDEICSCNSE